jgi:hypothetical protein
MNGVFARLVFTGRREPCTAGTARSYADFDRVYMPGAFQRASKPRRAAAT